MLVLKTLLSHEIFVVLYQHIDNFHFTWYAVVKYKAINKVMYGCQQILIKADKELEAVLEFVAGESNKLRNCGVYYARQMYFKTGKIVSKDDLHSLLKTNPHFQALYASAAQQTLTSVAESFKSFVGLLKGIKNGSVTQRPKMPGYRKNSLALIAYPKKWIKLTDGLLRFPLGLKVKAWFGLDAFHLPMPSNLDFTFVKEVRILPPSQRLFLCRICLQKRSSESYCGFK